MGLPIPSISSYLQLEWWELHEAAYILSRWPPCIHAFGVPSSIIQVVKRGCIYGWGGPGKFNPKILGHQFKTILSGLRKAIENGELTEVKGAYVPGSSSGTLSFVRNWETVTWALLQGCILPEDLSNELGVFQINEIRKVKNCHNKIKNQIVAQFLREHDKTLNVTAICNHDLMKRYGTWKISTGERKAIKRAVSELYDSKGTPGAPSKKRDKDTRPYTLKPIRQICELDENGVARYCFPLLMTAILTAVDVKIDLIGLDELNEMTEQEFMLRFFEDPVIKLYMQGLTINARKIVIYLIMERLRSFFSHEQICNIPIEVRKKMTVGQLREKNKEFCLELLTPEERNRVQAELDFSR